MIEVIQKIEEHLNISINHQKYLLIGNAFDKKALFLYKDNANRPHIVVRIPMTHQAEKLCENEYNHLLYLKKTDIKNVISSDPLGIIIYHGINCYIQKTIFSNQMQKNLRTILKIPRISDFSTVVNFLITMYLDTKKNNNFENRTFTHCFQHGDFWIGNLGLKNNSLVLYDLEYANKNGYPLYDLLHFGLHYFVVLNNVGKVGRNIVKGSNTKNPDQRNFDSIEELFITDILNNRKFTKLLRESIKKYTENCKIDRKDSMFLIKNYFEKYRGVNNLKTKWEEEVYNKLL